MKFPLTIRGYAEDEVDTFLDLVIDTMGDYERRDAESREEIQRLRTALDECLAARLKDLSTPGPSKEAHDGLEARVEAMLENATRTSERIVEDALEAGEHILDQIRAAVAGSVEGPADDPTDFPAGVDEAGR